jgi:hypothetical protein
MLNEKTQTLAQQIDQFTIACCTRRASGGIHEGVRLDQPHPGGRRQ